MPFALLSRRDIDGCPKVHVAPCAAARHYQTMPSVESAPREKAACILGASGGIGAAFVNTLRDQGYAPVHAGYRSTPVAPSAIVRPFRFDLLDEATMERAASGIACDAGLDLIVVATGMLHEGATQPEKSLREIDGIAMQRAFAVNSVGPAIAAKYFAPLLARDRRTVFAFLSARVGSIGDNRLGGWHSYRASKAALNALVRCFAIELAVRNPQSVAVALHPGTVDTNLSEPFQKRLKPGQLQSPATSARHLLSVIDALTPADSGGFFAWDGTPIVY